MRFTDDKIDRFAVWYFALAATAFAASAATLAAVVSGVWGWRVAAAVAVTALAALTVGFVAALVMSYRPAPTTHRQPLPGELVARDEPAPARRLELEETTHA